jgi:hypothetical protein
MSDLVVGPAQPQQQITGVVQAQPTQTIGGVVQAQPNQTINGVVQANPNQPISVPPAQGVAPATVPQLGPTAAPQTYSLGDGSTYDANGNPVPKQTTSTPAPTTTSVPTPAPANEYGALGNGTVYDQNGNVVGSRVDTGTSAPATPSLGSEAGLAQLSPNDLLSLLGSQTALSSDERNQIYADLGIPGAVSAAFAPPTQSTQDVYQQGYDAAGLGDVKTQILALNDQISKAREDLTTATGNLNENPFLSEASRVGRLQRLQEDANSEITNLVNQQGQLQSVYANGLTELNNLVTRHTNDFTTNQQTNQQKLTYLLQQAETNITAAQNAKIARYLPDYLASKAQATPPTVVNTPNGGSFYFDKNQGKLVELTPPVGSFTPYTNALGQTGVLNQQTGQILPAGGTGAPGTPTTGAIQIPQNVQQGTGQPQLAFQNNNPGNLMYAGQPGAVQGAGGFAKFGTPEAGYQALVAQVQLDAGRGLTLGQYITKYAPPSSNNTAQYIQQATQALGVSANTPLASINANQVATFQAMKESGTVVGAPSQGNTLGVQNSPSGGQSGLQVTSQDANQITQAFNNLASSFTNTNQVTYARYVLNNYLAQGDTQGAWDYLKTQAINNLDTTQQDAYNTSDNGIQSFEQALTILSDHPELNTGPYQNLIQSAKPWLGQNKDQDYSDFNQAIQFGTTAIRHGLFGARLTDSEVAQSSAFLPDPNDTIANVSNKLKGAVGFFQYVNDKLVAQKLGAPLPSLQTYLQASGYQQ